jgi:hypothetical protein
VSRWAERGVSGGIPFGNLDPLTDGTLKLAKPDFYEGALPEQLIEKFARISTALLFRKTTFQSRRTSSLKLRGQTEREE